MTAYSEYYDSQRKVNSRLIDCLPPRPFFDKVSSTCVGCPDDHPYFNMDLDKCESCGSESYDKNSHRCIDTVVPKHYDINPSIGRFMANVI